MARLVSRLALLAPPLLGGPAKGGGGAMGLLLEFLHALAECRELAAQFGEQDTTSAFRLEWRGFRRHE